jgi:hypothetical protein
MQSEHRGKIPEFSVGALEPRPGDDLIAGYTTVGSDVELRGAAVYRGLADGIDDPDDYWLANFRKQNPRTPDAHYWFVTVTSERPENTTVYGLFGDYDPAREGVVHEVVTRGLREYFDPEQGGGTSGN